MCVHVCVCPPEKTDTLKRVGGVNIIFTSLLMCFVGVLEGVPGQSGEGEGRGGAGEGEGGEVVAQMAIVHRQSQTALSLTHSIN